MRPLPFIARPILLTELPIMAELSSLAFLALAIASLITSPINLSSAIVEVIWGAPALVFPLWWWSRKLVVTPEGVMYTPWIFPIAIPYGEVRTILIEGRQMAELGHEVMIYRLSIQGAQRQAIHVTMRYYHTADVRVVVEEILAHAEHARLKGLARRLLDGTHSFATV